MLLASYTSVRPGLQGLANIAIRLRTGSRITHSEVVFEAHDGVDHLMPDETCQPDASGALWCASSVAAERLPEWSPRRAGKVGGVRFKRIVIDPARWAVVPYRRDPLRAAQVFKAREGAAYNWTLIAGFMAWIVNFIWRPSASRQVCSQICAEAGGVHHEEAHRFDPATLHAAVAAEDVKEGATP